MVGLPRERRRREVLGRHYAAAAARPVNRIQ
jgi:hypothetical protein